MADWSILYVGELEALRWRNSVPETNDEALCFLFRPGDRRIDKVRNKPAFDPRAANSESAEAYDSWLQTTVGEARRRFDGLGLTAEHLDRWISGCTGIPVEDVGMAVIRADTYHDGVAISGPLDESGFDARFSLVFADEDPNDYWENSYRIEHSDVGTLPTLRNLRRLLDTTPVDAPVWLDFYEPVDFAESAEDFESFKPITLDYDGAVRLDRDYLQLCKAHYSAREFDLVYIELIIALEAEVEAYLQRKFESRGHPSGRAAPYVKKMLQDLSFASLVRFIFEVLETQPAGRSLVDEVEKAYNARNNIIHQKMRTFDVPDVYHAITSVEESIRLIRTLPTR